MIDTLPLWFWLPAVIIGWSWLAVLAFRSITDDPNPEYSRLDLLDGLGSRTD
jgi:hypothetical protein